MAVEPKVTLMQLVEVLDFPQVKGGWLNVPLHVNMPGKDDLTHVAMVMDMQSALDLAVVLRGLMLEYLRKDAAGDAVIRYVIDTHQ